MNGGVLELAGTAGPEPSDLAGAGLVGDRVDAELDLHLAAIRA